MTREEVEGLTESIERAKTEPSVKWDDIKESIKGEQKIYLKPHERPTCTICGDPMKLLYYPRPSGRPGNRYVCDCIQKRRVS